MTIPGVRSNGIKRDAKKSGTVGQAADGLQFGTGIQFARGTATQIADGLQRNALRNNGLATFTGQVAGGMGIRSQLGAASTATGAIGNFFAPGDTYGFSGQMGFNRGVLNGATAGTGLQIGRPHDTDQFARLGTDFGAIGTSVGLARLGTDFGFRGTSVGVKGHDIDLFTGTSFGLIGTSVGATKFGTDYGFKFGTDYGVTGTSVGVKSGQLGVNNSAGGIYAQASVNAQHQVAQDTLFAEGTAGQIAAGAAAVGTVALGVLALSTAPVWAPVAAGVAGIVIVSDAISAGIANATGNVQA